MSSGARLRSRNQAFGRSISGAFLISLAPIAPSFTVRVPAEWDYVNASTNTVPSDVCEDRNPPDPTPGPERPDLGNITGLSRFTFVTQCFIRDFSPGYNFNLIVNAGEVNEFELPLDMTLNGLPRAAFSDYDPNTQYVGKNDMQCLALFPSNPILTQSGIRGAAGGYLNPAPPLVDEGWQHLYEIYQWNNELLATTFDSPLELELTIQAGVAITAFQTAGATPPLQTATSVGHGLLCGCAVRIYNLSDPPDEIEVRILEVTDDTFTWNLFFHPEWIHGTPALWQPAYDSIADQVSCP